MKATGTQLKRGKDVCLLVDRIFADQKVVPRFPPVKAHWRMKKNGRIEVSILLERRAWDKQGGIG